MKGFLAACALIALALAGCSRSAAPAAPTPPSSRPLAAITPLHPALEREAGHLLAAIVLLQGADHDLRTAFQLLSIQLPESADASFGDARRHLAEAQLVLQSEPAGRVFHVVNGFLIGAVRLMVRARAEGRRDFAASKRYTAAAETALTRARTLLQRNPNTRGALALAVEQQALEHAVIVPAPPRPTPAVTVVSSPRLLVADTPPTPTVGASHVRVRTAARREPRRKASRHPSPRPTATVTATPAPEPSRTPTTVAPTPSIAVASSVAPLYILAYSVSLAAAALSGSLASVRVKACGEYLQQLTLGDDPLGSEKILRCIDRALARTQELQTALARISPASDSGAKAAGDAVADLTAAERDVETANTSDATLRINDAGLRVGVALGYVLSTADHVG